MRAGCSPGGDAHVRVFRKYQHVVAFILYIQAFLKAVSVEIPEQGQGGRVSGLGIVDQFAVRLVSVARHAEVMFRLRCINTIVVPVVPNRDWNSVRGVGEKLSREDLTLAVFSHTSPRR